MTHRTPSHLRLVERQPVDLIDSFAESVQFEPPTFGEKLVDFFRRRGDCIVGWVIAAALGSLAACAGEILIVQVLR